MDSATKKALTGDTVCKLNNQDDLQSSKPSSFTATISGVKQVYNLFPGTVLFLGYYKNMGTLVVSVSNHEIVRYLNLKNIRAWNNQLLEAGELIGETYPNKGLQFEYCTQWQGNSVYPVRVANNLYYKQNPIDILKGQYTPQKEVNITYGSVHTWGNVEFSPDEAREWLPTSADNSDTYIEGSILKL